MKRLLIADDHPVVLSGLAMLLQDSEYEVVAQVRDGAAALEAVPSARPDILLLDVSMPERSGLDVLRTLRLRGDNRPVVLLTADIDDQRLLEAVKLNVSGIMLKDSAPTQLFRCLDEVARGGRSIEPALLQRTVDITMSGYAERDPLHPLTVRERAIAELVAQGLSNREIGSELGITEGTVKVALHRAYEKLNIGSRTELALKARSNGG